MADSSLTISDICFVLMPFGIKANPFPGSVQIDFDRIFKEIIVPAIEKAGLTPLRSDQEIGGGLIHHAMFERLLLCEYAIADLTSANPNVYYELGIRHAVRPWSTVLMCAEKRLPFDVKPLRTYFYQLDEKGFVPTKVAFDADQIYQRLMDIREWKQKNEADPGVAVPDDSPLFELLKLQGYAGPDLKDFHPNIAQKLWDCVHFTERLAKATSLDDLRRLESELDCQAAESAPGLLELYSAYRRHMGWKEMISLADRMPAELSSSVYVQEQYGMALGRLHKFEKAEQVLQNIIETRGASNLTYCFLGVIRKMKMMKARTEGDELMADGAMAEAIEAFVAGFRMEPGVVFCGINAVLLLHARNPRDKLLKEIFPVVRYFIEAPRSSVNAGFWVHAAELELAFLDNDEARANRVLPRLIVAAHEPWMTVSILTNLRLLREERERRNERKAWHGDVEAKIVKELGPLPDFVLMDQLPESS